MKTIVLALGIILLILGAWGFFSQEILGLFTVNALQGALHLATGLVLVFAAIRGDGAAALSAKIFGIAYLLVALLGFIAPDLSLNILRANMADHILHAVFSAMFLWIGFLVAKRTIS